MTPSQDADLPERAAPSAAASGGQEAAPKDAADTAKKPTGAPGDESGAPPAAPERKPPGKMPLVIVGCVVVVLAVGGFAYWFSHRNQVSSDDAYTDGNAVTIAPRISGYVVDLLVNDNQFVHRNDVLIRIDSRDALAARASAAAAVEMATGQLESARAQLAIAKVQYPSELIEARAQEATAGAALHQAETSSARQHDVDVRATTLESIDAADTQQTSARASLANARARVQIASQVGEELRQAQAQVDERLAQVTQAKAQLDQANLNLSYCEVRAPSDGWVTRRSVDRGSYLQAGAALFTLVTPDVWVTANFKETQLARMRRGDPVDITVDAYPDLKLSGHVDSIQLGSGSRFSAFPAENATGNFVKIVQRVPVKIVIDHGLDPNRPLPLGLSVAPVVRLS